MLEPTSGQSGTTETDIIRPGKRQTTRPSTKTSMAAAGSTEKGRCQIQLTLSNIMQQTASPCQLIAVVNHHPVADSKAPASKSDLDSIHNNIDVTYNNLKYRPSGRFNIAFSVYS